VVKLVTIGHGRMKMKKIDAINKIKKVLRKYKDGYEDEIINANEKDLSLIAKDILDSLEGSGITYVDLSEPYEPVIGFWLEDEK
jgi:hypothetical protein